jgi:heat shock protein HslJ
MPCEAMNWRGSPGRCAGGGDNHIHRCHTVSYPEKYTIELPPDGQFHVRADCSRGSGTYTLEGSHTSFELGPMTLAPCPMESLSDEFMRELNAAAITFPESDNLFIDLQSDSGTMRCAGGG